MKVHPYVAYGTLLIIVILLLSLPIYFFVNWNKKHNEKFEKIKQSISDKYTNIKTRKNNVKSYSEDIEKKINSQIKPSDEWQCIQKNETNSLIAKMIEDDLYCFTENGKNCREGTTPSTCEFILNNKINLSKNTLANQLKITPDICGDDEMRGWCNTKNFKSNRIKFLKSLNNY